MFPHYTYPLRIALNAFASLLVGGRRSFRADATACIARLKPPLQVLGSMNIPRGGPCLLIFNHYYRPGFPAWWMTFAIASVVPQEVHFVMTSELTYPGKWYASLGQAGSRLLLRRISRMYGFTTMPPMPPRPRDVAARADSVRAALAYLKTHPRSIIGLAPEGGDKPGGILDWPARGAGRFITLLVQPNIPVVPLGIYEAGGSLCLNFGAPYKMEKPAGLSTDERDHWAIKVSMEAIARQLPPPLRGIFG